MPKINKIQTPDGTVYDIEDTSKSKVVANPTVPSGTPNLSSIEIDGNKYKVPSGGGSANWGDIGGTLSDQTDLQNALDGKLDDGVNHSSATDGEIIIWDSVNENAKNAGAIKIDTSNSVISTKNFSGNGVKVTIISKSPIDSEAHIVSNGASMIAWGVLNLEWGFASEVEIQGSEVTKPIKAGNDTEYYVKFSNSSPVDYDIDVTFTPQIPTNTPKIVIETGTLNNTEIGPKVIAGDDVLNASGTKLGKTIIQTRFVSPSLILPPLDTVTFTDPLINDNATYDIYTNIFGVNPSSVIEDFQNNSITINFEGDILPDSVKLIVR